MGKTRRVDIYEKPERRAQFRMKKKVSFLLNIVSRKYTKNQHSLRDYVFQSLYMLQLIHRGMYSNLNFLNIFYFLISQQSCSYDQTPEGCFSWSCYCFKGSEVTWCVLCRLLLLSFLIGTNSLVKGTKVCLRLVVTWHYCIFFLRNLLSRQIVLWKD